MCWLTRPTGSACLRFSLADFGFNLNGREEQLGRDVDKVFEIALRLLRCVSEPSPGQSVARILPVSCARSMLPSRLCARE